MASVVWVGTGSNNEINAQTDAGHRIRVTASGGGNIANNTDICVITFATPYRYKRPDGSSAPMVPAITALLAFATSTVCSIASAALSTAPSVTPTTV